MPQLPPPATPLMRFVLPSALPLLLLLAACGGERQVAMKGLPANVMARPNAPIGVLLRREGSVLPTALRALGVPYQPLPLTNMEAVDLAPFRLFVIDEELLADRTALEALRQVMIFVKYGATLVVLHQEVKPLAQATSGLWRVVPREVDFGMRLVAYRDDPVLARPNVIDESDLDSLSGRARQVVQGGENARAIIAGNRTDPDAAAALLWDPLQDGTIWYLGVPILVRAAGGFPAEQKLLANLLSGGG